MIFNKLPMQVLVDIFKDISDEIPIYKGYMTEDKDTVPDSYMVFRTDVTNSPSLYGDGKSQIRNSDCEISLISKGFADKSTSLHNRNIAAIKQVLDEHEISFNGFNLGYDDIDKSTHYTFSFGVNYVG